MSVNKQRYLDGLDVSPLKWSVLWCGLNRFVHEGMNHVLNVKVHLKTRKGNVNIYWMPKLLVFLEIITRMNYLKCLTKPKNDLSAKLGIDYECPGWSESSKS